MAEALARRVSRKSKAYRSWSDPDVRIKSTGFRFAKHELQNDSRDRSGERVRSASSASSDEMSALPLRVALMDVQCPKGGLVLPSAPDIPLRHPVDETIATGCFDDVLEKCRSPIFADSSETPGLRQKHR